MLDTAVGHRQGLGKRGRLERNTLGDTMQMVGGNEIILAKRAVVDGVDGTHVEHVSAVSIIAHKTSVALTAADGVVAHDKVTPMEVRNTRADRLHDARPLVTQTHGIGHLPIFGKAAFARKQILVGAANAAIGHLDKHGAGGDLGNRHSHNATLRASLTQKHFHLFGHVTSLLSYSRRESNSYGFEWQISAHATEKMLAISYIASPFFFAFA